jgi:hypothetical protein
MAHVLAFNRGLFRYFVDQDTRITRGINNVIQTITLRGVFFKFYCFIRNKTPILKLNIIILNIGQYYSNNYA